MIKIQVKKRLNEQEHNQLYSLLYNSYGIQKKNKSKIGDIKNCPKKTFIVAKFNKKIVGFLILVKRRFYFFNKIIKSLGMSFMVVESRYHTFQISKKLLHEMFIISEKYDVILGFAKKIMDNYYIKYGFLGISNFSKVCLKINDLNTNEYKKMKITKTKKKDLIDINKIYNYANTFSAGFFLRDKILWKYYFLYKKTFEFYTIFKSAEIIGYFIINKKNIIEINCKKNKEAPTLYILKRFLKNKKYENIIFETNLNSPFINYLKKYNHSLSTRYAWNGGHILKIVNFRKFINLVYGEKKYNFLRKFFRQKYLLNNQMNKVENQIQFTKLLFGLNNQYNLLKKFKITNSKINFSNLDHF